MTDPTTPPVAPYTAPASQGQPTNVLAIIALIGAFVLAPVGIICGHIALGQIKRTGEGGHALALWGTILGYVFTILWILIIVFSFVLPLIFLASFAPLTTIG
jgi:hypothetical protein